MTALDVRTQRTTPLDPVPLDPATLGHPANARAARDHGLLPIVIGDATGAQRPDQERAAFERINSFFAPVISADTFAELVAR